MTYVTQAEFDALPNYELSEPTFHPSWLEPGRYWKFRSRTRYDRPNEPGYWNPWFICCYVTAGFDRLGRPLITVMYDQLQVKP